MNEFLDIETASVFVGAGLILAGVAAGWLMSTLSSRITTRPSKSGATSAEARELALRAILALDEFVGACQAAVNDTPEFNPSDPSEFVFHIADPRLRLPRDADWSTLNPELAEQLLWLPNRIRNVLDGLDSLDIEPAAFGDLFEYRQEDFSRLALRALDLIARIAAEYKLPEPQRPAYYDPRVDFEARVETIVDARNRRRALGAIDETSNVTPLFPKRRRDPGPSAFDFDPKGV